MKIFITMVSITILFIVLVFLGMPEIVRRQTADVYSKVRDMETQIRILEDFKKEQEKGWKLSGLKSNADAYKVIKVVQGLALKASDIENDLAESMSLAEDFQERQNNTMNELNQKLAAIERKNYLNYIIANITTHVIGAKIELASKNVGNIRAELQNISEKMQKAKSYAEVEQKKLFDDLTFMVENINTEVSVSLPTANSMINLLWYDLEKISKASQ